MLLQIPPELLGEWMSDGDIVVLDLVARGLGSRIASYMRSVAVNQYPPVSDSRSQYPALEDSRSSNRLMNYLRCTTMSIRVMTEIPELPQSLTTFSCRTYLECSQL